MTRVQIYKSARYQVVSYGIGLAYDVTRLTDLATLWLQGDSALVFGKIFNGNRDFDDAIADYDNVFEVKS